MIDGHCTVVTQRANVDVCVDLGCAAPCPGIAALVRESASLATLLVAGLVTQSAAAAASDWVER